MMKVRVLLLAVTVCAMTLLKLPLAYAGNDGVINFSGKLVADTCTISVSGSGAAVATIALPHVSRSGINGVEGMNKGGTGFNLRLTNCTGGSSSKARVFFQGGARVNDDGTLANGASSHGASGVALQLYDASMNPIQVGSSTQLNAPATALGGLMGYTAQYVSTSDAVGSGAFTASVTYSISYE